MKHAIHVNERMLLDEALSRLCAQLGNAKVQVKWAPRRGPRPGIDALVELLWEGTKLQLAVEIKVHPHSSNLRAAVEQIKLGAGRREVPVVVAPYLDPQKRKMLRESDVSFFDASGNAFIKAKGFFIHTENDKNPLRPPRSRPSLFTDKGALILKKLLEEHKRRWKVRELAEESGASLGMTSKILNALKEAGYSSSTVKDGFLLIRIEDLLSEWVDFYRFERRNLYQWFYFPAPTPASVLTGFHKIAKKHELGPYAFTLHAAGRILDPFVEGIDTNHVYVSGDLALWASKLKLIRANEPNLVLVQPYYKTAAFADSQKTRDGVIFVSDLQLFLDFFHFPQRGREAAEHLFEKKLAKKLKIGRFF